MRLLSIDNVKEHMKLARNIYSADGNVLLAEGSSLTARYIERLKELGISSLYIIDKRIGKIEVDELVKVQTRNEVTRILKETLLNIRDGRTITGEQIQKVVSDVMDEVILNRNVAFSLIDVRAMNDYHFSHNVTVCILSIMTGIALNLSYTKLHQLGVGAILHDVGKIRIPETLLNKKEILAEREFVEIQKHAQIGYDLLKKCNDINSVSAMVAWEHHERFDGTGYPRGIQGAEIHQFARIAAVADVYDALSTDRIYRKRLLPHEVLEYIRDKGKGAFDPEVLDAFLLNIAPFPIGSMVLLNSGEKGVVIKVAKEFPTRPIVKIIYNYDEKLLEKPLEKDLTQDLTVFVIRAIND